MFDENDTEQMPIRNFKQMIGFIGDSFLGDRLFHVTKQSYRTKSDADLISNRVETDI